MPYKSQKQAAYMHIHHPEIAKRWDAEYGKEPMKSLKKHLTKKSKHERSAK